MTVPFSILVNVHHPAKLVRGENSVKCVVSKDIDAIVNIDGVWSYTIPEPYRKLARTAFAELLDK